MSNSDQTRPFDDLATPGFDRFATRQKSAGDGTDAGQRFTVLRVLNRGGLGRVSVALDGELNREIALKEIIPEYADDPESRGRFLREAEITGNLEHPGVVPVYSLGESADGRPYYAMRFIRGVDLQTAITDFYRGEGDWQAKEFQFRGLLERLVDACHAVDYAHSRGVIHRDLKPSNIMVGDFGETLVVDWGLARLHGDPSVSTAGLESKPIVPSSRGSTDVTQAGRVVGTLPYMSPEQAAGRIDLLSPASDVYGLGATLYHLLTGRPPFGGDADDMALRVEQGRFPKPREINPRIPKTPEAICLKAMARRAEDRYASVRDLALDLQRYLADEPVSAYVEPATIRAMRWVRRHRATVLSIAAATVVGLAALSAGVVLLSAANRRERAARDEADRHLAASIRERERAERNFERAQAAVRDYLTAVSEETLLDQPGMQPLRNKLLGQALGYYEQFLTEHGEDRSLQAETARAHYYVGRIREAVESPEAALAAYRAAAAIERRLLDSLAGGAEDDEAATDYGNSLNAAGRALHKLHRWEDALTAYRQAIEVRQRLLGEKPGDAQRARLLASSVMNAALVKLAQGDAEAAVEQLQRAQALRTAHADAVPPDERAAFDRDLGTGYFNLATALTALGDARSAATNYEAAAETFSRLHDSAPNDLENTRRLANCRRLIADLRVSAGEAKEAVAIYEQASELLEPLVERNPGVREYAADLAGVDMNLAAAQQELGEIAQAATLANQAVDLLERDFSDAPSPRQRRDLGVACRSAGQLAALAERRDEAETRLRKAKEILAELVRQFPDDEDFAAELQRTVEALAALGATQSL
jgi:serine/threonine-protein kinase